MEINQEKLGKVIAMLNEILKGFPAQEFLDAGAAFADVLEKLKRLVK